MNAQTDRASIAALVLGHRGEQSSGRLSRYSRYERMMASGLF